MRIAIFFTPPVEHPLTRAAAQWLGRDAFSGENIAQVADAQMASEELRALTEAPRRYGFHATMKPPFRLVEGRRLDEVNAALESACESLDPISLGPLRVTEIGSFFALTPLAGCAEIDALAAEIVRRFEPFRAPLTTAEIARRRPDRLTPRQNDNLERWGYPYVFADFRFHMTLTGPVRQDRRAVVRRHLERRFLPLLEAPVVIDALSLFVEPSPPGNFKVKTRVAMSRATQRLEAE